MSPTVSPTAAARPFIFTLDLGTSSARTVLYDAQARAIEGCESQIKYEMTALPDGGVEIAADELVSLLLQAVDAGYARATELLPDLANSLAGVGCTTFWHALIGVDAAGQAVTPLLNWSDTRSAADAARLADDLGVAWIVERTGVRPHASYYPAKILWLRRTQPAVAARVARWVSIGEYFYERLFGQLVCGVGIATGTGLFNPHQRDWDDEMLAALQVAREQLAPLAEEKAGLRGLRGEFAARWPALAEVPWLPAVGDGAASNLGSGCATRDRIAINVGTSGAMRVCWPTEAATQPSGLWFYRPNRRYALIGGALSNGGDVYAWCNKTLKLNASEEEIEAQLAALEPDGHGLTVLPFFSGERSTGWHSEARASLLGLNLSTQPLDILRAALESVCYRFAAIYERLRAELGTQPQIIASGGAIVNSTVWTQMMADVIGVPVAASAVPEASSRGAALLALEAFGVIESFAAVATPLGQILEPQAAAHARYLEGRVRQAKMYELLIENQLH